MKHAFLVIAHNEEALLLALLKQLNYKDFDVYLHIDAKAKGLRQSIERRLNMVMCSLLLILWMYTGEMSVRLNVRCYSLKRLLLMVRINIII